MKKLILKSFLATMFVGIVAFSGLNSADAAEYVQVQDEVPSGVSEYFYGAQYAGVRDNMGPEAVDLVITNLSKKPKGSRLVIGEFDFFGDRKFKNFVEVNTYYPLTISGVFAVTRPVTSGNAWLALAYIDKDGKMLDYTFVQK